MKRAKRWTDKRLNELEKVEAMKAGKMNKGWKGQH